MISLCRGKKKQLVDKFEDWEEDHENGEDEEGEDFD
jgi:hypothetical protein